MYFDFGSDDPTEITPSSSILTLLLLGGISILDRAAHCETNHRDASDESRKQLDAKHVVNKESWSRMELSKTMAPIAGKESIEVGSVTWQREAHEMAFALKSALALEIAAAPFYSDRPAHVTAHNTAAIQIFEAAATFTELGGFIAISARGDRSGVTAREYVGKTLIDEIEYRLGDRVGASEIVRALRAAAQKALGIEPPSLGLGR